MQLPHTVILYYEKLTHSTVYSIEIVRHPRLVPEAEFMVVEKMEKLVKKYHILLFTANSFKRKKITFFGTIALTITLLNQRICWQCPG